MTKSKIQISNKIQITKSKLLIWYLSFDIYLIFDI